MNKDTLSPNSQEILSAQSINIDWLIGPYRDRIKVKNCSFRRLPGDYKKKCNIASHFQFFHRKRNCKA